VDFSLRPLLIPLNYLHSIPTCPYSILYHYYDESDAKMFRLLPFQWAFALHMLCEFSRELTACSKVLLLAWVLLDSQKFVQPL
jgi:hypothetical protein